MTGGGGALFAQQDLEDLAKQSQRIVVGTVQSFQSCTADVAGGVSTSVVIDVAEHLKGDGSQSHVTVEVPGGRFGTLVSAVGTSPEFNAGEQVVVFLESAEEGSYQLASGSQGKYTVADGEVAGLTLPSFEERVRQAAAGALPASEDPLVSSAGEGEAAYVLTGAFWDVSDIPVEYFLNTDENKPAQLTVGNVQTAWTNAFNTWENDAGSDIDFTFAGETDRDSGADGCVGPPADGNNDLTWGIAGAHNSAVLAVTYGCFFLSGEMIDSDIEFDADAAHFLNDWRTDGTGSCGSGIVDLEAVTLHELGHFIGLTHPSANGCPPSMCPVLNSSYVGVQRNLCTDDRNGVAALYPASGPTSTPTNTNTPGPTNTPTFTRTPTPTRTPTHTPLPPTSTNTPAPPTNTPTHTNTPVVPPTNTPTYTNTPVVPPTHTPTYTNTPVVPATNTPTAAITATHTPDQQPTATPTSAVTATNTPDQQPTNTPTISSSATSTAVIPTATVTPTASQPTNTPTVTATATEAAPTSTPESTNTFTPTRTATPTPSALAGDANCDRRVNSLDALAVLQKSAGLIAGVGCSVAADVNLDGSIGALDAALILQYTAGLVDGLPVGALHAPEPVHGLFRSLW
jgi:hypothetical protein